MARSRPLLAGAVLVGCLLTSCATGPRPSFSDEASAPGTPTGDPTVDAVLAKLDQAGSSEFSADYEILTRFGAITSLAEVVQNAPDRRTITIGDVRFAIDGTSIMTCHTDERCVQKIDDSFVSDLQVTHQFYGEAAAANLRLAAANRIADSQPSTERIAGQRAHCVSVEVTGGVKRFCALDSGALALLDDAAVRITLTRYSDGERP
jgi:hypothetical protein